MRAATGDLVTFLLFLSSCAEGKDLSHQLMVNAGELGRLRMRAETLRHRLKVGCGCSDSPAAREGWGLLD